MMSSVKAVLRQDKMNSRGEAPVYLRITVNRKSTYKVIPGVAVSPDDWDDKAERIKKSKRIGNYVRLNNLIIAKKLEAQNYIVDVEGGVKPYRPNEIKRAIAGYSTVNFTQYATDYVEALGQTPRYRSYQKAKSALSKLQAYAQKDLLFGEVDYQFLNNYQRYLSVSLKNSNNTILTDFKVFRKLFNDAVREDIIPYDRNPFTKFKFHWDRPSIEYLTEGELSLIENLELPYHTRIGLVRNIYVFACYAGGLRVGDVLNLKWYNLSDTHMRLVTQKTDCNLDLKLPQKALEIIDFYKQIPHKPTDYVFPFLNPESTTPKNLLKMIERKTAYINKQLKEIARQAGISKRLHFHTSRHTFAVRAIRRGIGIYQLSKILTHTSVKTTQIYLNIANEDLDKAMSEAFD